MAGSFLTSHISFKFQALHVTRNISNRPLPQFADQFGNSVWGEGNLYAKVILCKNNLGSKKIWDLS